MARFYYFPRPYPDELIGSLILRACQHLGTSFTEITIQLTGYKKSHLPLSISSWLPQIAKASGMDEQELLWEHTVFPYVTRFMSQMETTRLAADLLDGNKVGNAALTQPGLLGSPGHRFCLLCLQEDLANFGEVYWHREHNLPMVELCNRHNIPLQVDRPLINLTTRRNSAVDHLPKPQTAEPLKPIIPIYIAREISTISAECLIVRNRKRPVDWCSNYRSLLRTKGFPQQGIGLAGLLFAMTFEETLGTSFLRQARLAFSPRNQPWPTLMLRELTNIRFSTPKHVLMKSYLNLLNVFELVLNKDAIYLPPGPTPRDYEELDAGYVRKINEAIHVRKKGNIRIEIAQMLRELGILSTYRHSRDKLPKTKELISKLRKYGFPEMQI
ncbi:TniQ family protein [Crenobacter sp. SG2303]|uniref:TniQ family protein n=1 Tax=Crenobacter oryzisoli TaxID=3056844 RepID=A0ABT7XNQ6_9NEIS|nr:TniQ family protein [Crenobacter sp. SG2303]MDN0075419.1 TniQ family protein [Crenobacter sp. SG2303]